MADTAPGYADRFAPLTNEMSEFADAHVRRHWTQAEIRAEEDVPEFLKMRPAEQHAVKRILSFFRGADGMVLENLKREFPRDAADFPVVQAFYEAIHAKSYQILLEAYVPDPVEREACRRSIETEPSIRAKCEWALRWLDDPTVSDQVKNTGFAIMETMLFPASFAVIFWFREQHKDKLRALVHANRLIALDENLHSEAWCHYICHAPGKPSDEVITQMVTEAAEIEFNFVRSMIPEDLWGLSQGNMIKYVKYVADFTLRRLGVKAAYGVECPFDFMLSLSMPVREAVHEVAAANYDVVNDTGCDLLVDADI
jgi:ribonucleoside-diphosphate reductase subunit M2